MISAFWGMWIGRTRPGDAVFVAAIGTLIFFIALHALSGTAAWLTGIPLFDPRAIWLMTIFYLAAAVVGVRRCFAADRAKHTVKVLELEPR